MSSMSPQDAKVKLLDIEEPISFLLKEYYYLNFDC